MSDIGYNDNVHVADRKFHIQTASNLKKGLARCEVFEDGRVITTQIIEFERRRSRAEDTLEQRIRRIVSELHQETIDEIDLMFQVSEKVNKLRHAPSNIKLGLLFLHNNLIKDAIEQFEAALEIDPESGKALNNLGLAYIKNGQHKKAVAYLKKALEKNNPYADVYHNLGLAYLNLNLHYDALKNFQEALKINPNYLKAQYNLSIVYLESILVDKGDGSLPPPSIRLERAQFQLKKISESTNDAFNGLYKKINELLLNSEIEPVIELLVLNRDKVFPPEVLGLIGMDFYLKLMYGGKGLNNDIIRKFERKLNEAIEIHPDYADLRNNLGVVHLIQCRNLFLQALNEFDKALEINPSFEKALKNKKLVENDGKEFLILLRAILR